LPYTALRYGFFIAKEEGNINLSWFCVMELKIVNLATWQKVPEVRRANIEE
jgi:hypothetical protein